MEVERADLDVDVSSSGSFFTVIPSVSVPVELLLLLL
jgi:hypothetical protein